MKLILQNKLLTVFLIVFILIGTICSSVYAVDFVYDNTTYTVPPYNDLLFSSHYCLFINELNDFFLFISENNDGFMYFTDNGGTLSAKNSKIYKLDKSLNSWTLYLVVCYNGLILYQKNFF